MILFICILAIVGTTLVTVLISTEEARIRQQGIASVEQRGAQVLQLLTHRIRRAEKVLSPATNLSGAILALQMGLDNEFPTIFARTASGNLLMAEKETVSDVLSPQTTLSHLTFRNVNDMSVILSFDLQTIFPLPVPLIYSRHFDGAATLFPDDQSDAGGCGSCPLPTCANHTYSWYECVSNACSLSPQTISC